MTTFIQIDFPPLEHAASAYSSRFYVEALQVLHSYLELQIRELLYLVSARSGPHENFELAIDDMFYVPLSTGAKVLFLQGAINKSERDTLTHVNRIRNVLIHSIFAEAPNRGSEALSKADYDSAYLAARRLINLFGGMIFNRTAK